MNKNLIHIIIHLLVIVFVLLSNSYQYLGNFYFYFIILILGSDVIVNKKVSLLTTWNFAFLFIVLPEVFHKEIPLIEFKLIALQYLIIANSLVNIGFHTKRVKSFKTKPFSQPSYSKNTYAIIFILLLVIIYFLFNINRALFVFAVGRNVAYKEIISSGGAAFYGTIINTLGFILPATLTYYYVIFKKKNFIYPLILSSPIFLILFLKGTRFPLLFSLLGIVIVYQSKFQKSFSFKNITIVVFSLLALFFSSRLMKHFRSTSTMDNEISLLESFDDYDDVPTYVTSFFSSEGVIDMTSLVFNHIKHNNYTYGLSTSYILIFWIPRTLWPNKPTMLGHWFIRKYRGGFSDAHSSSFGFTGDLLIDFGPYISLILTFLLGRFLLVAENFKNFSFSSGTFSIVLGAMCYPYVFFFVRSPITATTFFIGIYFFYRIFKKLLT